MKSLKSGTLSLSLEPLGQVYFNHITNFMYRKVLYLENTLPDIPGKGNDDIFYINFPLFRTKRRSLYTLTSTQRLVLNNLKHMFGCMKLKETNNVLF